MKGMTGSDAAIFPLMSRYNQWMNQRVYAAAARVSEDDLYADRGAYFRSVFGTLNHILVGDTLWLKRFGEHPRRFAALAGLLDTPLPACLDSQLYDDLPSLSAALAELDSVIIEFADALDNDVVGTSLSYIDTQGHPYTKSLGLLLQHFFNHQTHHRGQVTTLLSQCGVDVGVTDFLEIIPNLG